MAFARRQTLSKWALIVSCWTFLALLFSGPQMIQALRLNRAAEGWKSVFGELVFSYLWLGLTPFAIWLSRSFRIEGGQRFTTLTIHFAASVAFLLIQVLLFTVVSIPFGWYAHLTPFWNRYFLLILNFTASNVMFYWGIVVIEHAFDYYRKLQDRELKASQLEAQLAQSQLQVLKMQLHPHFLFNTLNAISALIQESPDEADEMVSRLGNLLRMTLEVEDDGPGLRGDTPPKERVGLTNTRARVSNLYGDEHGLRLRHAAGGGLVVSLSIPFRTVSGNSQPYA